MVEALHALLLGIIQGLTEFLPVSSSGHLVLAQNMLSFKDASLLFDIWLHFATLIVVIFYYRRDIMQIILAILQAIVRLFNQQYRPTALSQDMYASSLRLGIMVIIASVPTALMGFLLKDSFERLFSSTMVVGIALLATSLLLLLSQVSLRSKQIISWHIALVIGVFQGFAITPGISRSGSTIVAALMLGIPREQAARFSFLCSIPAILGALLLQVRTLVQGDYFAHLSVLHYSIGFVGALLSGLFALMALVKVVKLGKMHYFAPYTLLLGLIAIFYSL